MNDYDTLLFCAFRYALGRSTYITADVSGLLIKYKDDIEQLTKEQIKKEIKQAIADEQAGMMIDIIEWERVLGAL